MNRHFVYIIAEGVSDVTLIASILSRYHGMKRVDKIESLDSDLAEWLKDNKSYSWPVGGDLSRLAVPAPVFLADSGRIAAICNAESLSKFDIKLKIDFETFQRRVDRFPDSVGIVLDSDQARSSERFLQACTLFQNAMSERFDVVFPSPSEIDSVAVGPQNRFGVFVVPGGGRSGTLEDVLLPLGRTRFPRLFERADAFVQDCVREDVLAAEDARDIRKPKGPDKATISAAVSLLKPGRNVNASLQDNNWLPDDPESSVVAPLNSFLGDLLRQD
jgi:hypothetical protein